MPVTKSLATSCYTKLSNQVIEKLACVEGGQALGVFVYLQSKPESWKFYKKEIRNVFNLSLKKVNNLLSVLNSLKLIEYKRSRTKFGKFVDCDIYVNNGEENLSTKSINKPVNNYKLKNEKPHKQSILIHNTENPQCGKSTHVENPQCREITPINKEYIYKEIKREKEEPSLINFLPDQKNIDLSKELGICLTEEIKSFMHRHIGPKTQYEFERWIKMAHNYKERKNNTQSISNLNKSTYNDHKDKPHFMNGMKFADELKKNEKVNVSSPEKAFSYLSQIKGMLNIGSSI